MQFNLGMYLKNQQAPRWYPVEVSINGVRREVVECLASSQHDAYHMAIRGMSAADLDRACDGVTLRVLVN